MAMIRTEATKGRRRWLVLVGAHISLLICGGTYRCFGVFLLEWKQYFDTSSAGVSAIISSLAASVFIAGILSGPLVKRFGCHNVHLLGASISIVGTLASVPAPSPILLCATIGLVSGLGIGLVYNSAQVAVAHYFKKGYSRANSVVTAGVAVGIMVLPPIFQVSMDHYGWRGTLLLLTGLHGQLLIASLLFRPQKVDDRSPFSLSSSKRRVIEREHDVEAVTLDPISSHPTEMGDHSPAGPERNEPVKNNAENKTYKLINVVEEKYSSPDLHQALSTTNKLKNRIGENESSLRDKQYDVDNAGQVSSQDGPEQSDDKHDCVEDPDRVLIPLENVSEHFQPRKDDLSTGDSDSGPQQSDVSCCYRFLNDSGWTLFGQSLGFGLFNFCQFTQSVCYSAVMAHFVASVVYEGVDEQSASFLLSVLGIASFISRLSNGWLIDLKIIGPDYLYVVAMVVLGGTTVMSRASNTYGWYVFIAVLFGASSGVCILPVLMRRYVGVENLAPAIGVAMVSMGVGDLLGPVLAGALYDASQSYDLPFYVTGSILMVTVCLLLLERPLRHRCKRYRITIATNLDVEDIDTSGHAGADS